MLNSHHRNTQSETDQADRISKPSRLYTRRGIEQSPPDILITNHVMLERILTGRARTMLQSCRETLRFIVIDELHTFRGAKADHLSFLLRRVKELLSSPPIMVGASATLGEDRTRIEAFGSHVLGVKEVDIITPLLRTESLPPPKTNVREDSPEQVAAYGPDDLKHSPLVHRLSGRLHQGPASIADLAWGEVKTQALNQGAATRLIFETLRAIGRAARNNAPILDLRVHIFLPSERFELRRCVRCARLSWAGVSTCPDCGFPAFAQLKSDPRAMICKVAGRRLVASLTPSADDGPAEIFATLRPATEAAAEDIRFHLGQTVGPDIELLTDPEGAFALRLLESDRAQPTSPGGDIKDKTIRTSSGGSEEAAVVEALLRAQPPNCRRVLAFQDNREGVSRIASVFRDAFASDIFRNFVCMHAEKLDTKRLDDVLLQVRGLCEAAAAETQVPDAAELWRELPFWFFRACAGNEAGLLLELAAGEDLTDVEQEVLQAFLSNYAIADFRWQGDPEKAQYIFLSRYHACRQHVIYIRPIDAPASNRVIGRSLGADSRLHADIVRKHTAAAIAAAIQQLIAKGRVRGIQPEMGKIMYVLEPTSVRVRISGSIAPFRSSDDLLRDRWLRGDVHSSDLSPAERVEVERKFKSGESHYILATPTLEMGIDIGDLKQLVMLGVPPAPGNYAQRAGRAGRNHQDRSAVIVCLCSDRSSHDAYFSRNPQSMIAGLVPPPSFNPQNAAVARKHLHATLLTPYLSSYTALQHALQRRPWLSPLALDNAEKLFGQAFNVRDYVTRQFSEALKASLLGAARCGDDIRNYFYNSGFFPDYGFHREEVEVRDPEAKIAAARPTQYVDIEEPPRRVVEPIAKREPEQAYSKFRPGRELSAGGRFYRLESPPEKDAYTILQDSESPEIRSYKWMVGRDEGANFSGQPDKDKLKLSTTFESNVPFIGHGRAFEYLYDPECRIRLVNHGVRKNRILIPYSDQTGIFRLGYELQRSALVFHTDSMLMSDSASPYSFLSAAAVVMKRRWGIADDEVRVFVEASGAHRAGCVIFCDADGNGNVPFQDIIAHFGELIRAVYDTTVGCDCDDGCLHCLRSWFSQSLGGKITRQDAAHFAAWLLGLERLRTAPAMFPSANVHPGLPQVNIKWNQHAQHLVIEAPGRSSQGLSFRLASMEEVYAAICTGLRSFWSPSSPGVRLTIHGLPHLVGAIQQKNDISEGRQSFERIMFELLRYPMVCVE